MNAITVRIPGRFFEDHESRALDTGRIVRTTKTVVVVECDTDELNEWIGDADYYSDPYGPGEDDPSLRRSAQATVRAVRRAVNAAGGEIYRDTAMAAPRVDWKS